MQKVSRKYDVTSEELKSNSRHSRVILPRFTAIVSGAEADRHDNHRHRKEFGDRDHSTVVNAVNKIEENLKKQL
jgi:chromosomal replication initiation ATPase DnaA